MDFDLSKENIQPLRGGRNVTQLGVALQAQTNVEYQRELIQQKEHFEKLIETYEGNDPLDNWYHYISWVEQSYPKHGHEGNLVPLLEYCLGKFENDRRYTNDRRFCKLWIKYIDLQQNPLELYQMMYARGLCRGCADLYRAWAYYHEAAEDFQNANLVFEYGKRELAQPYEELEMAHKNLFMAAGQHVLLGKDERRLQEKRHALTSLQTYRPGKVASIRMGSGGAGMLPNLGGHASHSNAPIPIYEDPGEEMRGAGAAPTSILSVARRQDAPKENTLKPGPWTTVPVKKRHTTASSRTPFTVHEDSEDINMSGGLRLPENFPRTTLEDYTTWKVNLTIAEPVDNSARPMYPKAKVYSQPPTEFSLEEIRAAQYLSRRNGPFSVPNQPFPVPNQHLDGGSFYQREQTPQHQDMYQFPVSNHTHEQFGQMGQLSQTIGNSSSFAFTEQHIQPQFQPNISTHSQQSSSRDSYQQHSLLSQQQHAGSQLEFVQKVQSPHQSPICIYNDPKPVQTNTSLGHQQMTSVGWPQDEQQQMQQPFASPAKPVEQPNLHISHFDIWNLPSTPEVSIKIKPKNEITKFNIYEQSNLGIQDHIQPKGSAMKTPFKVLNADELAETGSRGGMDIAAAAQPIDSARRLLPPLDDSSGSSFEEIRNNNQVLTELNNTCDTQMFNFNLKAMQVSTPQHGQNNMEQVSFKDNNSATSKKQLFADTDMERPDKALSTILEETREKSYGSSSSSGAATKSSIYSSHTKHANMGTISEEHNSYLAQNLMANAELRSSLLGDLMDFDTQHPQPMQASPVPSAPSSPVRTIPPPTPSKPLERAPSDPFKPHVLNTLLERINFPGVHTDGYILQPSLPKLKVSKDAVRVGKQSYIVEKQLGKGTFGVVYKAQDVRNRQTVALKYQKPANRWEFYICRELQARLINHQLIDRFMDVTLGYFSDQASILVSKYMPCGSLLDLVNTVKQKSGKPMKESLCIYFCFEMLRIVEAMHQVKIIHADIKPDNFLIHLVGDSVTLQLIDFGCSIDMNLFPPNTVFTRKITTEDFVCCEMRDGRPWSYHTDMFCIAATAHVLLFDKYIQLQKKDGLWSITQRLPRYMRMDLWNMFFSSLLNQHSGPAESLPLQMLLEEALNHYDDFLGEMRFIINILKNR